MRNVYLALICLLLPSLCIAQINPLLIVPTSRQADSLKFLASSTENDTIRMAAFRDLTLYYLDADTDSAGYFVKKELPLAKQLNLKMWEAEAIDLYSIVLSNMGNWAGSLEMINEAFALLNDKNILHNTWRLNSFATTGTPQAALSSLSVLLQMDLSNLYKNTGDDKKYKSIAFDCIEKAAAIHDQSILAILCVNMGVVNVRTSDLDSAAFYYQKAVAYATACSYFQYISGAYNGLAEINYLQGNLPLARAYYNKAFETAFEQQNLAEAGEATAYIARILNQQGHTDSAFYFARQSVQLYRRLHRDALLVLSYNTMAKIFESGRQYDSAYHYLSLAEALKDSVQTTENSRRFQNMEFNEQIRQQELNNEKEKGQARLRTYGLIAGLATIAIIACILYWSNVQKRRTNTLLENTLQNLKSAQAQLIHSEKMASLGELTAGIAHEIQNPLNFINNFSELNKEMLEELKAERLKQQTEKDETLQEELLNNVIVNEEKITHHGKRADAIVKGMLQHSRQTSGLKEPTDINALCNEYIRLAYHGLQAKDKNFQADIKTHFDETIGKINIVPQDMGRVILNLVNNAFYAINEKSAQNIEGYQPAVTVSTRKTNGKIEISITDNGSGIPESVKEKIFQPFFTTKPTGQGTGLGLSLAYDIVTQGHGGRLNVQTDASAGTVFIITLPL